MLKEYIASIKDKKVSVIGIGVSNQPLIRLLAQNGVQVTAHDKKLREQMGDLAAELEGMGVRLVLGPDYLSGIDGDIVFRTPGLHPDVPALREAVARGAELTSEMEVFLSLCPATVIAITGSDGKTTTTTVISELLKAQGYRVFVGGNIGNPLLDRTDEMGKEDFVVLELSSFQLLTMKQSPHVAVITNLAPNHLDVHKDMDEYVAAKENIFLYQKKGDILVTNLDNDLTVQSARKAPAQVRYFSRRDVAYASCTLGAAINVCGQNVMDASDIKIPGVHNIENYLAAFAATADYVDPDVMQKVAMTFGGVEHRLELVRELDGVKYYNDSIASSPSRTIAGLRAYDKKVILIAGGYDKHIPFDVLGPEVCRHVKRLYLTGATARKIYDAVVNCPDYAEGGPEIIVMDDFTETVHAAAASAKEGDVVLLSPACAAFDKFKNFMVRGKFFKKLVQEL